MRCLAALQHRSAKSENLLLAGLRQAKTPGGARHVRRGRRPDSGRRLPRGLAVWIVNCQGRTRLIDVAMLLWCDICWQWAVGMSRQQRQNEATGGLSLADCPRFAMLRAARRLQQQGDWRQRCLSRAGTAADAEIVAITVAARFLLTPRSNDGDSQRVTVPNAAGSAAASTAAGLAPKVPVPGWGRGGCKDRCCHGCRAGFC